MSTSSSNFAKKKSYLERPSLYGNLSNARVNPEVSSILKGLELRPKRPKLIRRITWSVPLMSLAAILLVIGLNDGGHFVGWFESSVAQLASDEVEKKPASTPLPPVAVPTSETMVMPEVATIISEPVKEETDADTQDAALLATGSKAPTEVIEEVIDPAKGAKEVVAETLNAALKPKADGHIKTGGGAVVQKAVRDQSDSGKRTQAKSQVTRAAASKKNSGKDEDVDLIAALLSRVSSGPKTSDKDAAIKAPSVTTASRSLSSASVAKRERAQGGNRDIVTHAPEESIESLVKRCRALGFFEGELCRLRICSGMWDKNPACATSNQDSPL